MEKFRYTGRQKASIKQKFPEPKWAMDHEPDIDDLVSYNAPTFDDEIISELPKFFTTGLERYTDKNQRDVYISALLTLMSSVLRNVYVIHNKERHGLNLFLFVCANAGSGKSAMSHPLKLAQEIELYLKEKNDAASAAYEELKKSGEEAGDKPKCETFFIPANSSHASFIEDLKVNKGYGIIFETEADTLANTLKQDWGSYSEILRQSFHHETIKSKRKGQEVVIISKPYLSLCISGTPNQFKRLIPSAENGLLSRMLFYNFTGKVEWDNNVFNSEGWKTFEETHSYLGLKMLEMYKYLEIHTGIIFTWTIEHQTKLNEYFGLRLVEYNKMYGPESNAIIKRLGLIVSRIACVIRIVALFENLGCLPNEIASEDEDLKLSLHFIKIFEEHSFNMYASLPKDLVVQKTGATDNLMRIYNKLPNEFSRKEAVDVCLANGVKTRTCDDYLKRLNGCGLLKKDFSGQYEKTHVKDE